MRKGGPRVRTDISNIDDVLWKEAGCTTELDYVEQTSWLLFLKYLDDLETDRATRAELAGKPYTPIPGHPLSTVNAALHNKSPEDRKWKEAPLFT